MSNNRGHTNRGNESVVRPMELCKSHEVPVRNIHLQQCPASLKGQYFQKNVWGIKYSSKTNDYLLNFSEIKPFFSPRIWSIRLKAKKLSISRLIIEQYENENLDPLFLS